MTGKADGDTWDPLVDEVGPPGRDPAEDPGSPAAEEWPSGEEAPASPASAESAAASSAETSGSAGAAASSASVGAEASVSRPSRGAPGTARPLRRGDPRIRNPLRPRSLDERAGDSGARSPVAVSAAAPGVEGTPVGKVVRRASRGAKKGREASEARAREGRRPYGLPGHEKEGLSWLLWVLVGVMIIVLGLMGLHWAHNHSGVAERFYDPIRSIPEVREVPDRVPVSTLQISPPGYPVTVESQARHWEVRAAGTDWHADGEASWAGLEEPPKGTHWIAVAMDIQDRAGTQMGPWVDFTFHFAAEDGRQFSETQCWNHCLATAEGVEGRFVGYLFFLVPNSVSDAGYIVVTPLLDADLPFALRLQPGE